MPQHMWGDKDFDWNGLNDCCNIIGDFCHRYGRFGGQIKEKYGHLRFYVHFSQLSLHSIFYPGYVYNQLPKWLWLIDINYIEPTLTFFFGKIWLWWQVKVYNWAYQRALVRHPHLRAEILNDADCVELIKGASRAEGKDTVILGWNGEEIGRWIGG